MSLGAILLIIVLVLVLGGGRPLLRRPRVGRRHRARYDTDHRAYLYITRKAMNKGMRP